MNVAFMSLPEADDGSEKYRMGAVLLVWWVRREDTDCGRPGDERSQQS